MEAEALAGDAARRRDLGLFGYVGRQTLEFLEHLGRYIKVGRMEMKSRKAAVFGSYGYDGAWIMEERLKKMVQDLGYKVLEDVCVETDTNIKYHTEDYTEKCQKFGKEFAEYIKSGAS